MIEVPMNVYMKTLSGYINDEDKLVTYKWLSNELEIHVNVAKRILENYWSRHKNDNIVATILIMGYINDNEMRIELVKESDLAVASEKFTKIISQHIYSIQKTLSDIQLLAGAGDGDTKYSAIHCENSVLLSEEELFKRRWGTVMEFQAPQEERKLPIDKTANAKKSNDIGKFFKESVENTKPPADIAKSNEAKNAEEKKISPVKINTLPKKVTNQKMPVQSTKAGFNNLFNKIPTTKQKKSPPSNVNKKDTALITECEPIKENLDNTNNSDDKSTNMYKIKSSDEEKSPSDKSPNITEESTSLEKKTVTNTKLDTKSNENKKASRGKKRERSQESKSTFKKRKRIIVNSDTSEESDASDNEVIFDSPPRAAVEKSKSPSPPHTQNINGKRKIRKLVDKTYMDDDGFLVTKREYVYESCSEEEEVVKITEPEKKKKTEPPSRTIKKQQTQTTLKNFFKKG